MKIYRIATLLKMAREGRIEAETDIKAGYVNVRWPRSGKREIIKAV